jgi:hypothetical protein
MALCAAHDAIGLRHSLRDFKLYVKKQAKWSKITEHNPALMNGVSGESKPLLSTSCQAIPGSVLAACVNLESTTGQEFGAVLVQAACSVERFSGARVLQLDGYPNSN